MLASSITTGVWHHLVVVYDGSQLRVYIDGLQSNAGALPAPGGNANTFGIGNTSGSSSWFNGQVDEVALYTRALTVAEVLNHKNRGLQAPASTSVYERFGGLEESDSASPLPTITQADVNAPDGTDIVHDSEDPVSFSTATTFLYYNGHGDLAVETDPAGSVLATHTYDPFGTPLDSSIDNNTPVAAAGSTERYTGQWDKKLDTSTGLIEMGARPYDPALGRFYATDPIPGGSLNTYDYAAQDPINAYDLDGQATMPCPGHAHSYDCASGSPLLGLAVVAAPFALLVAPEAIVAAAARLSVRTTLGAEVRNTAVDLTKAAGKKSFKRQAARARLIERHRAGRAEMERAITTGQAGDGSAYLARLARSYMRGYIRGY